MCNVQLSGAHAEELRKAEVVKLRAEGQALEAAYYDRNLLALAFAKLAQEQDWRVGTERQARHLIGRGKQDTSLYNNNIYGSGIIALYRPAVNGASW